MQVAPGVHRLSRGISNFYVVEEGGEVILVDAGVGADWPLLSRTLETLGRSPTDLLAILLTHAHSDHTGFAEEARARVGARVSVHEADVAVAKGAPPGRNEAGLAPYLRHLEAWRTLFGLLAHRGVRILPIHEVSAFQDGSVLELPGRPTVLHLPGHTPGMAGIYLPQSRVLFTGDALVTRNPLTGRRGPQIMPRGLNQSSARALASLDRLEPLDVDLILPGHGEPWADGVGEAVRRARVAGPS